MKTDLEVIIEMLDKAGVTYDGTWARKGFGYIEVWQGEENTLDLDFNDDGSFEGFDVHRVDTH